MSVPQGSVQNKDRGTNSGVVFLWNLLKQEKAAPFNKSTIHSHGNSFQVSNYQYACEGHSLKLVQVCPKDRFPDTNRN